MVSEEGDDPEPSACNVGEGVVSNCSSLVLEPALLKEPSGRPASGMFAAGIAEEEQPASHSNIKKRLMNLRVMECFMFMLLSSYRCIKVPTYHCLTIPIVCQSLLTLFNQGVNMVTEGLKALKQASPV